jgi:hypothetical protein
MTWRHTVTSTSFGYHLLVYRRESLWLPAGLWALCAIIVFIFRAEARGIEMTGAYLAYVLPLSAGVLASGAILDDPSLELQFATPRPAWRLLAERLGLILGLAAVGAVLFQLYAAAVGVSLGHYGDLVARQLLWIVPSLALGALGGLAALGFVGSTFGALLAGLVWIAEILLKDWFLAVPWHRYLFLYLGERAPGIPEVAVSQLCLTALALAFVAASAVLLRREERYI